MTDLVGLDEPALVEGVHVHRGRYARRNLVTLGDLDDVFGLVFDPERHTIIRDAQPRIRLENFVVYPDVVDVAVRLRVVRIDREDLFPDGKSIIEIA